VKDLNYYIHYFKKLRRAPQFGGAPHKPILLLALLDLFEQGVYRENRIEISPELVGRFNGNWNQLVETPHHRLFALPFFYMKSEPFWQLIPHPGYGNVLKVKSSLKTLNSLRAAISHAEIDAELFLLLMQKENRLLLREVLLHTYFGKGQLEYQQPMDFVNQLEMEFAESEEVYKSKIMELKARLKEDQFEEEIFVRNGAFSRTIKKIYRNSCAISGLQINTTADASLIDACHIEPFSENYNDTIPNGIALCPNLHRAFDRGLLTIDQNYRVRLNNNFEEVGELAYGIRQFEGATIALPVEERFFPALKSLQHHWQRFGFSL
jgi:putative restriction endonuclease